MISLNKNLFLIHTPFQLLNCLNLIENNYKNDENDIVFLHNNMKQYTSLVMRYNEKITVYSYEFLFDDYIFSNKLLIKISLVIQLIRGQKAMKMVDNKEKSYDTIFIPSENIGCNIIYNYFYNLNNSLSLYVYDDGVGTYAKGYLNGKKHFLYEKISNLLYGSFFWSKIEKIYCYQPQLIDDSDLNIDKQKINSNKKVERLFSEKLNNDLLNKYNESKIIFLDQGNLPLSYENTKSFFEICNKFYKKNEVIYKSHPRVKPVYECNSFTADNSGNILEAIFFNIGIEDKVLVSMCSTSCLTPYILKEEYPYIIFLGLLNTSRYEYVLSTPYFKNVITNYKPNKVFIPRNDNELVEIIEMLSKKII